MPLPTVRRKLAVLAASAAALGGGYAWMARSTAVPTQPAAAPVPARTAPESDVAPQSDFAPLRTLFRPTDSPALRAMTFDPPEGSFLFGVPSLRARLVNGQIKISERGPMVMERRAGRAPVPTWPPVKAPYWTGPVARAQFTHEMVGGVDTLKDRDGKILWTNAAEAAAPDLLFQRTDGDPPQARLIGKKGAVLWSGTLTPSSPRGSSSHQSGRGDYQIDAGGIHVTGANGTATVTDDDRRVLWQGALPRQPVIVLRRGHDYTFIGPNRSTSGTDRVSRIVLSAEKGEVTVEDGKGGVVGTRAVDLLRCDQRTEIAARPMVPGLPRVPAPVQRRVFPFPPTFIAPRAISGADGKSLIYRDSAGKVITRSQGRSGNSPALSRPRPQNGRTPPPPQGASPVPYRR